MLKKEKKSKKQQARKDQEEFTKPKPKKALNSGKVKYKHPKAWLSAMGEEEGA